MPDHDFQGPAEEHRSPALTHLGSYRRQVPVSLERMYENALDWEHLPHLHSDDFRAIECEAAGTWGWRALVTDPAGHRSRIELRLDRPRHRWLTRTWSADSSAPPADSRSDEPAEVRAEIWTHAFELQPQRLELVIDFFAASVPAGAAGAWGAAYAKVYERLYDQDVAMMTDRQRALDRRVDSLGLFDEVVSLGPRDGLVLPQTVEAFGRQYRLAEVDGALLAYAALCPHQLGPLPAVPESDGTAVCPWHGYRFDVRSGACLSGAACRLPRGPLVRVRDGTVELLRPDLTPSQQSS